VRCASGMRPFGTASSAVPSDKYMASIGRSSPALQRLVIFILDNFDQMGRKSRRKTHQVGADAFCKLVPRARLARDEDEVLARLGPHHRDAVPTGAAPYVRLACRRTELQLPSHRALGQCMAW